MGRMTKEEFERARRLFDGVLGEKLIAHAEAIELELKISKEDEQRALDAMNRLMDNVAQLTNEKREVETKFHLSCNQIKRLRDELASVAESRDHYHKERDELRERIVMKDETIEAYQKQNEDLREPKKVALPKEVAEAIEWYKAHERSEGFVLKLYDLGEIKRLANIRPNTRAQTITRYIFDQGYKNYFTALVNGYTVEKTKEERLREGIREIYDNFDISDKEVINRIADFVTKFNAEN